MAKIKKKLEDADIGDLIEERYHCSNPASRWKKTYLIVAYPRDDIRFSPRHTFVCMDLEESREVIRHIKDKKNITYHFVG